MVEPVIVKFLNGKYAVRRELPLSWWDKLLGRKLAGYEFKWAHCSGWVQLKHLEKHWDFGYPLEAAQEALRQLPYNDGPHNYGVPIPTPTPTSKEPE